MPKEEPIKKQALLFPDNFTSLSFSESASDESNLPSGVKTQNHEPFGIFDSIKSASFSKPAQISAGDGLSGSLDSGNYKILN